MNPDVLIIGAGIVGSALAESCARRGMSVCVVEAGIPAGGATAAGMGHLVVLDDNAAELALSSDGVQRWHARRAELPETAEYRTCGTLWLARDEEEMHEAQRKLARYRAHGLQANLWLAAQLARAEPALAPGLAGALEVPGDAVLYPPIASAFLLRNAQAMGATALRNCKVESVSNAGDVLLRDGRHLAGERIVIAAGVQSAELVPGLPVAPRKGQLMITERYPAMVRHQLVELGYIRSAHGEDDSVAFNVQPRATGQLLIGSSRQAHNVDPEIEWTLLWRMLARAQEYLPGLGQLQGIRAWAGFRPATPDKLPLLGRKPGSEHIWLATGHEGLGITTALASAELLADLMSGYPPALDPTPYDPARFAGTRHAIEDAIDKVAT